MKRKKKQSWLRRNGTTVLLILVFLTGAALLAYPTAADTWNKYHQSRAIAGYSEQVADLNHEEYERMMQEAILYNSSPIVQENHWILTEEEREEYDRTLNVGGSGIMGYIQIDKIKCYLPIYHGTDEGVLQIAIGHIPGSSLPIGGEGSHCVLSGHRGLPSAKLFTDLDKMIPGDKFVIRTLDEVFTYEILSEKDILIVNPSEIDTLKVKEGEDLCTLVTCTPYGINTHRLLITGHRVENEKEMISRVRVSADAVQIDPILVTPLIAVPILLLILLILLQGDGRRRLSREELEQARKLLAGEDRPQDE